MTIDFRDFDDLERCHFPKYEGLLWEEVITQDRPYILWLLSHEGPDLPDELYEYLTDLLEETAE